MGTPRRPLPPLVDRWRTRPRGFVRKYNELWSGRTGLPIRWIEGAAHNSNADNPFAVNAIIEEAAREGNCEVAPMCGGFRCHGPLTAKRSAQMFGAHLIPASNDRVRDGSGWSNSARTPSLESHSVKEVRMSKKRRKVHPVRPSKPKRKRVVAAAVGREATLAAKPHYNRFACGHGAHGSAKYSRARAGRLSGGRCEGASRGSFQRGARALVAAAAPSTSLPKKMGRVCGGSTAPGPVSAYKSITHCGGVG